MSAIAIAGCDCGEDPAGGDPDADAGSGGGPDLGFDDAGNPIQPDLGFDDAGRPVQPDLGFDDFGNPVRPDLGFDDAGRPVQPDLGFDDAGHPIQPDLGFDDAGNPVRPDLGFDDAGRPVQPDLGFDDAGNPIRPDLGFDDAGQPINPDTGFDDAGRPVNPDTGFDDAGRPLPFDGGVRGDANPLEQPLSEFCRGMGTVVQVGEGGLCAGEVAQQTFRFGLCTCQTATMRSTLSVDAFDSTRGPYGGANILDDGHVGINGALDMDGKLTVRGGTYVGGGGFSVGSQSSVSRNVYAAGPADQAMSTSAIGRNAFFDGDVTGRIEIMGDLTIPQNATVEFPNLVMGQILRAAIPPVTPCPCAPAEILDVAGITAYGRTHNDNAVTRVLTATTWENGTGPASIRLPCGRYYVTRIMAQNLSIIAEGRTVLFVDGDMTIDSGLTISLAQNAELDLFIKGNLAIGSAARLGDQAHPSGVRTYIGGTGQITLNANTVFGGNVYAPRADVIFGASANLFGSLFAKNVTFAGSTEIHFDSAIRMAGRECRPPAADAGVPDVGLADGATRPDLGFDDAGRPIQPDSGLPVDAGPVDQGVRPDLGFDDAGRPIQPDVGPDLGVRDTGVLPVDTGVRDTGVAADALPRDTGLPPDTGVRDSGTPDSGPAGCTGCFSCGQLACIIPAGQQVGMCMACRTDLDCCPPLSCSQGLCVLNP